MIKVSQPYNKLVSFFFQFDNVIHLPVFCERTTRIDVEYRVFNNYTPTAKSYRSFVTLMTKMKQEGRCYHLRCFTACDHEVLELILLERGFKFGPGFGCSRVVAGDASSIFPIPLPCLKYFMNRSLKHGNLSEGRIRIEYFQ